MDMIENTEATDEELEVAEAFSAAARKIQTSGGDPKIIAEAIADVDAFGDPNASEVIRSLPRGGCIV